MATTENRLKRIQIPRGSETVTINLGDVFREDFADIENPAASVKSCQAAIIQILNLLRPDQTQQNS